MQEHWTTSCPPSIAGLDARLVIVSAGVDVDHGDDSEVRCMVQGA